MRLPLFTANYPCHVPGRVSLLTTPERTGARADYTGKGVTIAFLDSGYYPHPDLKGRILVHVDATTYDIRESASIPVSPAFSWHGQMTTVIAAGDGTRSGGHFRGIASGASLVLVKVSNPRNEVKEADILRGLRWVQAHHRRYGIRIVNLSVGGDYVSYDPYHPLHRVVRELVADGVTVIAGAGNSALDHLLPPASAAEAITVGGLDDNNTLDRREWTLYTHNSGMAYDGTLKPDLIAPARWIASPILPRTEVAREAYWLGALLAGAHQGDSRARQIIAEAHESGGQPWVTRIFGHHAATNLYGTLQARVYQHKIVDAHHQHVDGTSVAAPIVAAVVAQMLEANPSLTPADIRRILTVTAERLPKLDAARQGAGALSAAAAVDAARG